MLVCSGSETSNLQADDLRRLVFQALDTIESEKKRTKVLVIPPGKLSKNKVHFETDGSKISHDITRKQVRSQKWYMNITEIVLTQ